MTPTPIRGVENAVQVAAGRAFGCALLERGQVRCWGVNSRGQVGGGTKTDRMEEASLVVAPQPAGGRR
jgi:alpha-tubulin suppressor-like RCC1 family protein